MQDNNLPQIKEYAGQQIFTTKQLAKMFGTQTANILKNFERNKSRYVLGKHYILLKGQDLKQFKDSVSDLQLVSNYTSKLYLWTARGALLHAKSLTTDESWAMCDQLIDDYYALKTGQEIVTQIEGRY